MKFFLSKTIPFFESLRLIPEDAIPAQTTETASTAFTDALRAVISKRNKADKKSKSKDKSAKKEKKKKSKHKRSKRAKESGSADENSDSDSDSASDEEHQPHKHTKR
eukprot:m.651062 g.651062  ORF g.651062 m.651062 type:complete len:107 (-) comp58398_c0_seq9:1736-2056(-)